MIQATSKAVIKKNHSYQTLTVVPLFFTKLFSNNVYNPSHCTDNSGSANLLTA